MLRNATATPRLLFNLLHKEFPRTATTRLCAVPTSYFAPPPSDGPLAPRPPWLSLPEYSALLNFALNYGTLASPATVRVRWREMREERREGYRERCAACSRSGLCKTEHAVGGTACR